MKEQPSIPKIIDSNIFDVDTNNDFQPKVQFNDEPPAWIPFETLLAMQEKKNV